MRCSRYVNRDQMHAILNGEPLEEVDSFKYLGSQVAADGGCERDVVQVTFPLWSSKIGLPMVKPHIAVV